MCFMRFLLQARTKLIRAAAINSSAKAATSPVENKRKLHIVIGNESCDLDSAVSALTLAFIYAHQRQEHDYIPVLNIPRNDYPLKTEVVHMLNKCEINEKMLLFRDDLPPQLGSDINVILVDHNLSNLAPNVVEVLDHRPKEEHQQPEQKLPSQCVLQIDSMIGSCATLVTERYLAMTQPRCPCVTQLLHATIVLDTINFSMTAKRFCARDLEMVEQLEKLVKLQPRRLLFNELVAARADISRLSLLQVLRKDMKQLQISQHSVPLAGLPLLVENFIKLPDAELAIRQFAGDSPLLIILGMNVLPSTQVERDIAIISPTGHTQLVERVRRALTECQSPVLQLQPHSEDPDFLGGCFLRQFNVQATRKHILPVVKRVLLEWEASQHCDGDDVYFFKEKPKLGLS